MAQAPEHLTPTYNWSLHEAFRHLIRSVRLSDSDALYEMEQLRVEVQKYVDGKPQGDPVYRYKDFRLVVRVVRGKRYVVLEGLVWDSRCRVAEQDVRAIRPAPSAAQSSQESPKPKAEGWKVRRVKQALKEKFPPNGHPPADMAAKTILDRVNEVFTLQNWKTASRDTLARAMGRRRI